MTTNVMGTCVAILHAGTLQTTIWLFLARLKYTGLEKIWHVHVNSGWRNKHLWLCATAHESCILNFMQEPTGPLWIKVMSHRHQTGYVKQRQGKNFHDMLLRTYANLARLLARLPRFPLRGVHSWSLRGKTLGVANHNFSTHPPPNSSTLSLVRTCWHYVGGSSPFHLVLKVQFIKLCKSLAKCGGWKLSTAFPHSLIPL